MSGLRYFAGGIRDFYQAIYGDKRIDQSIKDKVYDTLPKSTGSQYMYDKYDAGEMLRKATELKHLLQQNQSKFPSILLKDVMKTLDDGIQFFGIQKTSTMKNKADKINEQVTKFVKTKKQQLDEVKRLQEIGGIEEKQQKSSFITKVGDLIAFLKNVDPLTPVSGVAQIETGRSLSVAEGATVEVTMQRGTLVIILDGEETDFN